MLLYTNKSVSPRGKINLEDLQDWLYHALKYAAPVGVMYLAQIGLALQDHQALRLSDLVPTLVTQGAVEAWVLSQGLALLSKFNNDKK